MEYLDAFTLEVISREFVACRYYIKSALSGFKIQRQAIITGEPITCRVDVTKLSNDDKSKKIGMVLGIQKIIFSTFVVKNIKL